MKKSLILISLISSVFFLSSSAYAQDPMKSAQDSAIIYKDGTYKGMSRAKYTYEPYWGIVRLTIKDGVIGSVLH